MDSKLVIEQMSGRWQIKNPGLRPLAAEAATLVGRFESVRFTWVPREQNRAGPTLWPMRRWMASRCRETELAAPPPQPTTGPRPRWSPPAADAATRMVLVRHGETELHRPAAVLRTRRRAISARSVRPKAAATASRLTTVVGTAAVVVTSPLSRCRRTAEADRQPRSGRLRSRWSRT